MAGLYRLVERHPPLPSELVELLSLVETATIGHTEHLGFVGAGIVPLLPARIAGVAVTVAAPGRDGAIIYRAVDQLLPGDVLVISRVDSDDIACVGGGVATAVKAKGAAGIIIDGPCTDPEEIIGTGLPVWCRGTSSKTTNRQFSIGGSLNVPVACGRTAILPGYAVLADCCGVFATERQSMRSIAEDALARQKRSTLIRAHLAAGHSIFDFKEPARENRIDSDELSA
ncbi:RraA family protein [Rhizobium sp. S163]|uniref:RraA family protein n=1 Tax=Rhizobium sp. S163 TaxID=3055039 RepID=UPI0025A97183|nr:RraA family protein [Rhizobium sp. S163]MDM9649190.1 RraA family protein [Rhizobium sp. S163]